MMMNKNKSTPLKKLNINDPYPKDFWNYNINAITGYYVEHKRNNEIIDNKYYKTSKPLPKRK